MGRLSAIFVALCMILIAVAIGAVLYLRFGLSGAEATVVGIATLTGLALFNVVATRQHERNDVVRQVADLSRLTAEVSRQMTELSRRVSTIDGKTQAAVESTLAATQPINAEMGEVSGLIKQIADAVAVHDTQLKGLSPGTVSSTLPPATPAPEILPSVPASAPIVDVQPEAPLAPLVAALPVDVAAPKPLEVAPAAPLPAETKPAEIKSVEVKPAELVAPTAAPSLDIRPVEAIAVDAKPVETKPVETKPVETKPVEMRPAEMKAPEVRPVDVRAPEVRPTVFATVATPPWVPAPVVMKPAETGSLGLKPVELKPAEPKLAEPKLFEARPVEVKATVAPMQPVDPMSARPGGSRFKDMDPAQVVQMIREAVDANRIDLFLQPIVTLPQRKVRYYEAVARLRAGDGEQLMAADFLPFAEAGGLMPKIDNMMLFRCVQVVRRLLAKNRDIGLFCNISASTLIDSQTFTQFAEFMEANKAIAPALVFEFTQAALRSFGPIENESLAALAERGYRFSLDNVTDLRIEPRDIAERGFRFVKVQAPLLLNRSGIVSDIHPQDFAGLLSRHGIELIAAKIESESAVVDLLDYDVKFGQGFLFSPPRPVRPEVMQGISGDLVVRENEAPPAAPPSSSVAAAGTPPVAHRLSSLAQLARGAVARN